MVFQGHAGAWRLLQIKPSMTSYVCWGRALLQQGMGAVQGKPLPFLPVLFVWNGCPSHYVSPGSADRYIQGAPCLARASCFPAPAGTAYPAKWYQSGPWPCCSAQVPLCTYGSWAVVWLLSSPEPSSPPFASPFHMGMAGCCAISRCSRRTSLKAANLTGLIYLRMHIRTCTEMHSISFLSWEERGLRLAIPIRQMLGGRRCGFQLPETKMRLNSDLLPPRWTPYTQSVALLSNVVAVGSPSPPQELCSNTASSAQSFRTSHQSHLNPVEQDFTGKRPGDRSWAVASNISYSLSANFKIAQLTDEAQRSCMHSVIYELVEI